MLVCSKDSEHAVIASVFGEENWAEGYSWVHSQIKGTDKIIAKRTTIEQAAKHIKMKYFDSAIKLLKGFDKNKYQCKDIAATNISFIYILEKFKLC